MKSFGFSIAALVGGMVVAGGANAALVGHWDFENAGDLTAAQVGSALVATGTVTSIAGSGGADAGAASLDNGDHFTVTNPIGVNGGGATETNEYTILMDIDTTGTGNFSSLLEIDGAGDGDLFIRDGDGGRLGVNGDYFDIPVRGTIRRFVFVYDLGSATPLTTYVDGVLIHAHTAAQISAVNGVLDGTFALQGTFSAFQDNAAEERTTTVSNLALFSTSLSAGDVAALGVAGDSIVPEPGSLALLGLGGLALLSRRR